MTVSSISLASLISQVRAMIVDPSSSIWDDDVIEAGIRQALAQYSMFVPYDQIGTITLSADGRELDISSLTGLISVTQVWLPYDSDDPEHPPNLRTFRHWSDQEILYFPTGYEPEVGDVARIFYTKLHTLDGLDSESVTTFSQAHLRLITLGSSGYSVLSRGRQLLELVSKDDKTAQRTIDFGQAAVDQFVSQLEGVVASHNAGRTGHIPIPKLDRFDRGWA